MSLSRRVANTLRIWWGQYQELGPLTVMLWIVADGLSCVAGAPLCHVSQITPKLHLGGQFRRRGWPILAGRGITAVVNLRAEFDDSEAGLAPPRYLYLPTADNEAPSQDQLRAGVAFVSEEMARGGSVYIHCHAGTGRAAAVTAAYLTSTGLTPRSVRGRGQVGDQVLRRTPAVRSVRARGSARGRRAHLRRC